MRDLRDGSRCRTGADGSLASRRISRKVLLLGGYVVAGWVGLCAFGGHHSAEAAVTAGNNAHAVAATSAHAGLLDAVTASALSGPTERQGSAVAAPSNAALALPHLSDLAPVGKVLDADVASAPAGKPAPDGAGPSSSVAGLPDAAHIGKQVEETLTAVTAPVRNLRHDVVEPVTKTVRTTTVPSGTDPVRTITDSVGGVVTGVTGSQSDGGSVAAPAPVTAPAPSSHSTAPVTAAPKPRATHASEATTRPAAGERVTAAPVPALDPATTAAHLVRNASSAAGAHSSDATQTPRGSLRSGAGAPTAPPQNPLNPGPLPVMPGNVAVAGASVTTSQFGSGFSGSALLADQMMMTAHQRAVHTVQHDNARIARAEAAAPSCSPD